MKIDIHNATGSDGNEIDKQTDDGNQTVSGDRKKRQ
jgi:hypothetical protein